MLLRRRQAGPRMVWTALAATDGISDVEEVTKTDDEEESERLKLRSKLGMPEFDPDEAMVTALPKMLLLD